LCYIDPIAANRRFGVDATRTYTVILEPAEEGGFVVHVPALPEVVTQGEDEAEALAMAKDAIELALEERLAEGEEIPAERAPQMRQVTVRLAEPSAA
jgi:antitoxin HicB